MILEHSLPAPATADHVRAVQSAHVLPAGSGFQPREMELRKGTFALFLSGQYNTATRKAYAGVVKQGSCASYVSFHNMTHFGMNDYVGPSQETHQVCPSTPLHRLQDVSKSRSRQGITLPSAIWPKYSSLPAQPTTGTELYDQGRISDSRCERMVL